MTEALLLIICEEGWLEFEALARAGGCNRSLYGVCEKALRPAVEKKRFRLFRKIERAALERVRRTSSPSCAIWKSETKPGRIGYPKSASLQYRSPELHNRNVLCCAGCNPAY